MRRWPWRCSPRPVESRASEIAAISRIAEPRPPGGRADRFSSRRWHRSRPMTGPRISTARWSWRAKAGIAGVIGIVASRIVDRFCRPTIMIALNNGQGQGSGRSVAGFHLPAALEACDEQLLGLRRTRDGRGIENPKRPPGRVSARILRLRQRSDVTDEMLIPQLCLESTPRRTDADHQPW